MDHLLECSLLPEHCRPVYNSLQLLCQSVGSAVAGKRVVAREE